MPKILEPLLLPQLVRARRSMDRSDIDSDVADLSSSFPTRNSSVSELSMPATPTFSLRGHSRYASSVSTDVTSPSLRSPPSLCGSPTDALEDSFHGKRSLPDVKEEEPVERDDDDLDMMDDFDRPHHPTLDDRCSTPLWFRGGARPSTPMYDLSDGFVSESDASAEPQQKKRRAGDSSLGSIASRLGERFPSFSRRWRGRRLSRSSFGFDAPAALAVAAGSPTGRPSHGTSSRASSITSSIANAYTSRDVPSPRAPSHKEAIEERDESAVPEALERVPTEMTDDDDDGEDERPVTTPLLPPLMVPEPSSLAGRAPSVQSPLQSPTVAGSPETFSAGARTPPISGRPSVSSLGGPPVMIAAAAASQLPTSEIPNIRLADPEDKWSGRLGHANFDIHPEPYMPDVCNAEACRQIRANWELARCNYIKHLVRTGAHYGATSKTYRLTEEKWAEIDADWKAKHDETVARAEENGSLTLSFRHAPLPEPSTAAATMVPSLSGPRSDGKFPQLGNEDIVGPMIQIGSQLKQSKPSYRHRRGPATLLKFLGDVRWPGVVFGVGGRFGRNKTT